MRNCDLNPARSILARFMARSLTLASALVLSGVAVHANNILLNPGYEASNGNWPPVAPTSWTYYGPGENYYIEPTGGNGPAHSGNNYYKNLGHRMEHGRRELDRDLPGQDLRARLGVRGRWLVPNQGRRCDGRG